MRLAVELLLPEERTSGPLQLEGLHQPPSLLLPASVQPGPVATVAVIGAIRGGAGGGGVPEEKHAEQVHAAARAAQRARVLEQQLAELTRRHNTATTAWTAERARMLASSSSASSGAASRHRLGSLLFQCQKSQQPTCHSKMQPVSAAVADEQCLPSCESSTRAGSMMAELAADELRRENSRLQGRVRELIGDLELQVGRQAFRGCGWSGVLR